MTSIHGHVKPAVTIGTAPRTAIGPRTVLLSILKILALTVALVAVSGVGATLFLSDAAGAAEWPEGTPASGPPLTTTLGVMLLQTLALAYPVARSRWGGWRLIATMAMVHFTTASFLGLIETIVYPAAGVGGMLSGMLLMSLFTAVLFAPILVLAFGKGRMPETTEANRRLAMPARTWAWKLALGAALYLALYYLFGYYVAWQSADVREFYGGHDPGSFFAQMASILRDIPWMVPFQYLRGLLWVLVALPVIRMMTGARWETGLALSLLFGVPALYLLFPNPVMPEAVRLVHLIETVPYQFLYGWLLAWLFLPRGAHQENSPPR